MISWHIRLLICGLVLVLSSLLMMLMRRKYLRPEYALVWAIVNVLLLLLVAFPRLLNLLTFCTGMNYQSSVILLAFVLICALFMNFSLVACRHGRRIVRLAQEVALLKMQLEEQQGHDTPEPESSSSA